MLKFLVGVASIAIIGFVGWRGYDAWSAYDHSRQVAVADATCSGFTAALHTDQAHPTLSANDRANLESAVKNCAKN